MGKQGGRKEAVEFWISHKKKSENFTDSIVE